MPHSIRYIKMGETSLTRKGDFFFGSTTYYLWYIIPLVLFVVFVIVYRKKAIENANVAKVRTKKANKVAAKRMKNAGRLLAENKQEAFYDEVLKALWGYISDKLNIPVSQLSKDNIEDELTKYGVVPFVPRAVRRQGRLQGRNAGAQREDRDADHHFQATESLMRCE